MQKDVYVDPRDNQKYSIIKLNDGNWWFAENLRFKAKDSVKSDPNPSEDILKTFPNYDPKKHGRLYDWECAKNSCPPSWRLPTREEWRIMLNTHCGFETGIQEISSWTYNFEIISSLVHFDWKKFKNTRERYRFENNPLTKSNLNSPMTPEEFYLGKDTPFNQILGGHYINNAYSYFNGTMKGCNWTLTKNPLNDLDVAYIFCFEAGKPAQVVEWTELCRTKFPVRCIME